MGNICIPKACKHDSVGFLLPVEWTLTVDTILCIVRVGACVYSNTRVEWQSGVSVAGSQSAAGGVSAAVCVCVCVGRMGSGVRCSVCVCRMGVVSAAGCVCVEWGVVS